MQQLSMAKLKENGIDALSVTGGLIAGHIAQKALIKKDSTLVHGGMAAGGLALATICKNDFLRMGFLGLAAYGTIRMLHKTVAPAVSAVAAPAAAMYGVEGIDGFLPESLKSKIRQFVPSIGNTEYEMSGYDEAQMTGYEELTGDDDLSGDDDMGYIGDAEEMSGFGNAAAELI